MFKYRTIFLFITLIFVMLFGAFQFETQVTFANEYEYEDRDENEGNEGNEALEEIGGLAGWGTIILGGFAGSLFPLRRSNRHFKSYFRNQIHTITKLNRLLSKWHILIGIGVLITGLIHGFATYLDESEFGFKETIGITSFLIVIVSSIFGIVLSTYKKLQSLRVVHRNLIAFAIILVIIHVA